MKTKHILLIVKAVLPVLLFLLMSQVLLAGGNDETSNTSQTGSYTLPTQYTPGNNSNEILVVVSDKFGKEEYSKILLLHKNGRLLTATDPGKRIKPGMYLIVATSDNVLYKYKVIIQ